MKRLIILLFFIVAVIDAKAQRMADVFIEMPDGMLVQLEAAWRKDLVDLYRSEKSATLENTMQGKSTLLKLTDDYLLLQSTKKSTVEMKLLPLVNNTFVVCVVTTVAAPVEDSRVEFYTTNWKKLPSENLFSPVDTDWFIKSDVEKPVVLNMDLIKYSLAEDKPTLTAEYTTPKYLSVEDSAQVAPLLRNEAKVYEWKMSRFE